MIIKYTQKQKSCRSYYVYPKTFTLYVYRAPFPRDMDIIISLIPALIVSPKQCSMTFLLHYYYLCHLGLSSLLLHLFPRPLLFLLTHVQSHHMRTLEPCTTLRKSSGLQLMPTNIIDFKLVDMNAYLVAGFRRYFFQCLFRYHTTASP